jgi:hypothetical protein
VKTLTVALLVLAFVSPPARTQCCMGAQNGVFTSKNGCYRVEATSFKGTGPGCHGPYSFRFRCLARAGEEWRELGAFDATWDTRDHFHVTVIVSPTGNGFLIALGSHPAIEFRTVQGKIAASYDRAQLALSWAEPADGRFVALSDPEAVPIPGHPNSYQTVPRGQLFVPLGAPVGPELEQRILALFVPVAGTPAEHADIKALVGKLGDGDNGVRAAAQEKLMALGEKAAPALEQARSSGSADQRRAVEELLATIYARTAAGHEMPLRNLSLLAALLTYPSAKVATEASKRLDALLPARVFREEIGKHDFPSIADWIETHAREFTWQPDTDSYQRK